MESRPDRLYGYQCACERARYIAQPKLELQLIPFFYPPRFLSTVSKLLKHSQNLCTCHQYCNRGTTIFFFKDGSSCLRYMDQLNATSDRSTLDCMRRVRRVHIFDLFFTFTFLLDLFPAGFSDVERVYGNRRSFNPHSKSHLQI